MLSNSHVSKCDKQGWSEISTVFQFLFTPAEDAKTQTFIWTFCNCASTHAKDFTVGSGSLSCDIL